MKIADGENFHGVPTCIFPLFYHKARLFESVCAPHGHIFTPLPAKNQVFHVAKGKNFAAAIAKPAVRGGAADRAAPRLFLLFLLHMTSRSARRRRFSKPQLFRPRAQNLFIFKAAALPPAGAHFSFFKSQTFLIFPSAKKKADIRKYRLSRQAFTCRSPNRSPDRSRTIRRSCPAGREAVQKIPRTPPACIPAQAEWRNTRKRAAKGRR